MALVLGLLAGTTWAAGAADPFVGRWKVDAAKSVLNDEMKVEAAGANRYTFDFGPHAVDTVVADGSDQPALQGTTFSVAVKDDHHWTVIRKLKGRTMLVAYWTLSADGNTLNDDYTEYGEDGKPTKMPYVYARTAGEASGGFGGTWDSETQRVKPGMELEIQPWEGDGLAFGDPRQGVRMQLKFDGKDYAAPNPHAAAGSAFAGRRVGERRLEIEDKSKGEVIEERTVELSDDLKTLTVSVQMVGQSKPRSVLVFERE